MCGAQAVISQTILLQKVFLLQKLCSRAFLPNLRTAFCQLTPLAFCFSAVFHVKKVQLDNVMRVICNLRASSITSATYC